MPPYAQARPVETAFLVELCWRGLPPGKTNRLMEPLLDYIEAVDAELPNDFVTVLLPEFIPKRWWHHVLHNQRALLIKDALLFKPNTVVTSVPFHLTA
jgi:hypothetical protein